MPGLFTGMWNTSTSFPRCNQLAVNYDSTKHKQLIILVVALQEGKEPKCTNKEILNPICIGQGGWATNIIQKNL